MGLENYTFWSEIGSEFEELGSTPPPRIPRSTPLLQTLPKKPNVCVFVMTAIST